MTDIVERLLALANEYQQHRPHYEEAENEIERVRVLAVDAADEIGRLRAALNPTSEAWKHMYDEIERLEDENEQMQSEIKLLGAMSNAT